MKTIRWGLVGTGYIADIFANDMKYVANSEIVAVASRSMERGSVFAHKHDIHKVFDQYEVMLAQEDIDAVYIATPHTSHKEQTILALKSNKAVLCEKPMGLDVAEVKEMIACAKAENVLLMEGMWTRFKPIMIKIKEIINSGIIGDVTMVKADFGFNKGKDYPETGRLLNTELAGGARLDVGIYPIAFARYIFEEDPKDIQTTYIESKTGVDLSSMYNFTYGDNRFAVLYASIDVETEQSAYIGGTKGHIVVPKFWCATECLVNSGDHQEHYKLADQGRGYEHEIIAFNEAIRQGFTEVDLMNLGESLSISETLERIQKKWTPKVSQ